MSPPPAICATPRPERELVPRARPMPGQAGPCGLLSGAAPGRREPGRIQLSLSSHWPASMPSTRA